jgi:nucleoside-diphosphate-sugar epimerase
MNILVLGAAGFIANHLVARLKDQGHYVCGIDLIYPKFNTSAADDFIIADLTEYETFLSLDKEFDEVYQLAAEMGGVLFTFNSDNDATIMSNNVQISLNLLKYAKNLKSPPTIFYSSSACMYPKHNQMDPTNPNCAEDSAYPASPDSEYGWEKLFSERLFLNHAKNYKMKIRIARFHNIFGPIGTWQGGREKAPAAICRKVLTSSDQIEIIGTGEQTRSFLYIDDCLDAVIQLTRSNVNFPINIGSEEMVTINQLVDIACTFEDKKLEKIYIPGPIGVPGRNSDNTLIYQYLGWQSKYSLIQGLEKTYFWIKQQIKIS